MNRKVLIVLGMHRSGTSCLTGLLQSQGIETGITVDGKGKENIKGFFENVSIQKLNKRIFKDCKVKWDSYTKTLKPKKKFLEQGKQIIKSEFNGSNLFVIKDPRICLLIPFWENVFKDLDIEIKIIHLIRNPLEVAESLNKRNGFVDEKSLMLWLHYVLEAEFYSRKFHRILISFDGLINNPAKMINRVFKKFDLDLQYVHNSFLEKNLKHHNSETNDCLACKVYKNMLQEKNPYELNAMLDEIRGKI